MARTDLLPVTKNLPKLRKALFAAWKPRGDRIFFADVDGVPWVTDSYIAMRVNGDLTRILDSYNLAPTHGLRIEVGQTIHRVEHRDKPVGMDSLVYQSMADCRFVARERCYDGTRHRVRLALEHMSAIARVFDKIPDDDGLDTVVDDALCNIIELAWPDGHYAMSEKAHAPLTYSAEDEGVVALVMPVRVK